MQHPIYLLNARREWRRVGPAPPRTIRKIIWLEWFLVAGNGVRTETGTFASSRVWRMRSLPARGTWVSCRNFETQIRSEKSRVVYLLPEDHLGRNNHGSVLHSLPLGYILYVRRVLPFQSNVHCEPWQGCRRFYPCPRTHCECQLQRSRQTTTHEGQMRPCVLN